MLKPSSTKITDFETTFDAAPVFTPEGEIIWADVRIDYILSQLTPRVTIRVPVPWNPNETLDQRRAKALRYARELIDHACRAVGADSREPETAGDTIGDAVEAIAPPALVGIAEELGIARPTTTPKQRSLRDSRSNKDRR